MASNEEQKLIPTLYNLSSSQSGRVLVALEELAQANGIKYHVKNISRKDDYTSQLKKVYPLGKAPVLTLENADGTPCKQVFQVLPGTLTETRLVLQFLNDEFANGIWTPESAEDKARDSFFQEFVNATLTHKADFVMLYTWVPTQYPFGIRHLLGLLLSPVANHFRKDLTAIFDLIEGQLSEDKPWFAGDKIGLSDFNALFGIGFVIQHKYLDVEKYPKIGKWHETMCNRSAFIKAMEKGGAYDLAAWK
jgi:glutathione S-transferase